MCIYYVWTKHGEREIMLDNDDEEEGRITNFEDTAMSELEEDARGHAAEDDPGHTLREAEEVCEIE